MTRRRLVLTDRLRVLVRQATCPRCGGKLGALEGLEWDHIVPLALGGADEPDNFQAIHKDCHAAKTRGRPATTAGSDIHAIAKAKRILKKQAEFRRRLLARDEGEKPEQSRWPKRPMRRT